MDNREVGNFEMVGFQADAVAVVKFQDAVVIKNVLISLPVVNWGGVCNVKSEVTGHLQITCHNN